MEPQIQLEDNEKDIIVIRIEVIGNINGVRTKKVYQVIDERDLETGFTAMSRAVGFTTSIGAQMIAKKDITKIGILNPVVDVPFDLFKNELAKRKIEITSTEIS